MLLKIFTAAELTKTRPNYSGAKKRKPISAVLEDLTWHYSKLRESLICCQQIQISRLQDFGIQAARVNLVLPRLPSKKTSIAKRSRHLKNDLGK